MKMWLVRVTVNRPDQIAGDAETWKVVAPSHKAAVRRALDKVQALIRTEAGFELFAWLLGQHGSKVLWCRSVRDCDLTQRDRGYLERLPGLVLRVGE